MDVSGLEDVGRGEILLLSRVLDTLGRGDVEVPATLRVEKAAKYGGGIEVGPVVLLVLWFYETGWSGTWGREWD